MIPVHFWESADGDLAELLSYLDSHAPASKQPILDDLARSLETISNFPSAGTQITDRHYRRIISTRYHFKIVYEVTAEQINILGIIRQQGREI